MTVIAVRNGRIAADSRETWAGGDTIALTEKLFRKKIGRREHIIATAGDTYSGMVYFDWYGSGKDPPQTLTDLWLEEDFQILVWDCRQLYTVNHLRRMTPVVEPFYAIGCGRKSALAAMHMGASARRAVSRLLQNALMGEAMVPPKKSQ